MYTHVGLPGWGRYVVDAIPGLVMVMLLLVMLTRIRPRDHTQSEQGAVA